MEHDFPHALVFVPASGMPIGMIDDMRRWIGAACRRSRSTPVRPQGRRFAPADPGPDLRRRAARESMGFTPPEHLRRPSDHLSDGNGPDACGMADADGRGFNDAARCGQKTG
jgi:hypothetical protein